jgi:F-type H+-transporting ATPase subunit delta
MPLLNTIATPYADALLQVAESRNETDLVAQQAKELLEAWNATPELRQAMGSPLIEPEAKKKVITRLFAEQVTPALANLLRLLADRQRISAFDAVLLRYLELYRELRHIALAKVTSAVPLSDDQKALLGEKVKAMAGTGTVEFEMEVDPALIGGLIVRVGSQVVDASLAGQVRRLGLSLARVG